MRKLDEDTANDELFAAYNGPEIGEADEVLRQSLNLHFGKTSSGWNIATKMFRTSRVVVEQKFKEKNKLNIYYIMCFFRIPDSIDLSNCPILDSWTWNCPISDSSTWNCPISDS